MRAPRHGLYGSFIEPKALEWSILGAGPAVSMLGVNIGSIPRSYPLQGGLSYDPAIKQGRRS